jgi:poly(U)-specific endoribonuclease
LFTFVDEKVLTRPTFAAFIALLDNYFAELGVTEVVTREELAENKQFLNVILDTAVMQYVHRYLLAKGKTRSETREAFLQELDRVWFGLYSRQTRNDSSGFEHVFLGEIKDNEVTGFHNWIRIYMEERTKKFDYQGYIKPKRRGQSSFAPHSQEQFISLQFIWNGCLKPVSSSFIGTSPEFEMALYTLCFYAGDEEGKSIVQCGPYRVQLTTYKWRQGNQVYIATSFPEEAPLDETEAATKIQTQFKAKFGAKKR